MKRARSASMAIMALLAGCGGGGVAPPPVEARRFEDPGFVVAGDYEMHYGVLPAASLDPGVASGYGIDRDAGQMVISVAVLHKRPGGMPEPVDAVVSGTFRSLVGDASPLAFRTLRAGTGVSYIAEAPLRDDQVIVLELEARLPGTGPVLQARLTRQFDRQ